MITIKVIDTKPLTDFGPYDIIHNVQKALEKRCMLNKYMEIKFSSDNIEMEDLKYEIKRLFFRPKIKDIDENTIELSFKEVQIV